MKSSLYMNSKAQTESNSRLTFINGISLKSSVKDKPSYLSIHLPLHPFLKDLHVPACQFYNLNKYLISDSYYVFNPFDSLLVQLAYCTSPSFPGRNSTKAPKDVTLITLPKNTWPGSISFAIASIILRALFPA